MILSFKREPTLQELNFQKSHSSISSIQSPMAPCLTIKHFCFAIAMLTIATTSCRAQAQQDSLQIVAKAALCFDNKTVIMNCISSAAMLNNGSTSPNATFCHGPCFGHAMLMVNCLDGIFSNFNFYNAGMFQGIKAVFQAACGKNVTGSSSENILGTSHGRELAIPMDFAAYVSMLLASIFLL